MEPVLDEGVDHAAQDALFCEGECQCWHHRWCAGVTKHRYAELADSPDPFLCPSCMTANQKATINSLRDCLNALTDEVRAMKANIAALQSQKEKETVEGSITGTSSTLRGNAMQDASTETRQPWSTVVRRGRGQRPNRRNDASSRTTPPNTNARNSDPPTRAQGEGTMPPTNPAQPTESQQDNGTVVSQSSTPNSDAQKVRAHGVRRVWGTLKSSSSNAVKNTISHHVLVSVEAVPQIGNIVVKRKYKRLPGNKIRWWFLVYMEEDSLQKLELEWEKVSLQTSWKLEPCHAPANFSQAPPSPPQT